MNAAQYRKAITAAVFFVVQLVQMNVLPSNVVPYVTAAIAALTVIGVYVAPNDDAVNDRSGLYE